MDNERAGQHQGKPGEHQGRPGQHGKAKGKDRVKQAMREKTTPKDRFVAFVHGVLDNAAEMEADGSTAADKAAAMADLRASVDEAWSDITQGGGK